MNDSKSPRVAVVTGPTSGVGASVARDLAAEGWHVVLLGRHRGRCEERRTAIERAGGSAEVVVADLSLLDAARRAADAIRTAHDRVDLLVNNAGAVFMRRAITSEGHERTLALNVLTPFLLTRRLAPALSASAAPRVVNVASEAHRGVHVDLDDLEAAQHFSGFGAYSRSKLALVLLTSEFARREPAGGTVYVSVHPGFVRSRFGLDNGGAFALLIRLVGVAAISPDRASRYVLGAAHWDGPGGPSGSYFRRGRPARPSAAALDTATARALYDRVERLVAPSLG